MHDKIQSKKNESNANADLEDDVKVAAAMQTIDIFLWCLSQY